MRREDWAMWAAAAVRDPSTAHRIAGELVGSLRTALREGEGEPPGYVYAGAHEWILSADDLVPELLPTEQNPLAVPVTSTVNREVTITVPFDAMIMGVAGWATITPPLPSEGSYTEQDLRIVNKLSCSQDGRDLFSVIIMLDGQVKFGTDGDEDLMLPASCVVGTRTRPRPMAWHIERNTRLQAKFRNLSNLVLTPRITDEFGLPTLRKAAIAFYALNLNAP